MTDKELADAIRRKAAELNELSQAAADAGLKVEFDLVSTNTCGRRHETYHILPSIERIEAL